MGMCRELEAADCGDVIFFPYAFMLRATAMNRIGHAQSDNERLNLSIMNDSPDNERLAPPKVTLSSESDPLREPKVILSPKSDTFEEPKVIHSLKSDPLETPIMNDSPDNERLNLSIMNDSPESDTFEAPIMNDSPNNERLGAPIMNDSSDNERLNLSIMNDSPQSPYAIFQYREHRMKTLDSKLDKEKVRIPTIKALQKVVCTFADNEVFGSRQIMSLIPCSEVTARRIITKLKELDLIIPIKGNGKGRYMFKDISE